MSSVQFPVVAKTMRIAVMLASATVLMVWNVVSSTFDDVDPAFISRE